MMRKQWMGNIIIRRMRMIFNLNSVSNDYNYDKNELYCIEWYVLWGKFWWKGNSSIICVMYLQWWIVWMVLNCVWWSKVRRGWAEWIMVWQHLSRLFDSRCLKFCESNDPLMDARHLPEWWAKCDPGASRAGKQKDWSFNQGRRLERRRWDEGEKSVSWKQWDGT